VQFIQGLLLIPVVCGSIYALLRLFAVARFQLRQSRHAPPVTWPAVTILKPVCGLEKDLEDTLRSTCIQDYPEYQVVLSVQRADDPALPILRKLAAEFGPERVSVCVATRAPVANGKIHNLANAVKAARHEILVISDSDIRLSPDFLKAIVAPLDDPKVGFACTVYRGVRTERWPERLELLSLHDFTVEVIFSYMTGASDFCLGSSIAFRRSTLDAIGGFEPLVEYLAEDWEMGARIRALGLDLVLVRHTVETVIDIPDPLDWWRHQLYWDLNTRFARPRGFLATVLIRAVPFALLFALVRSFDATGLFVLAAALGLRLATSGAIQALLGDREALRSLAWMPLRDVAGFAIFLVALSHRRVVWRGVRFDLTDDGRMLPVSEEPQAAGDAVAGPGGSR
jgi:ceramide glucosyltransferase